MIPLKFEKSDEKKNSQTIFSYMVMSNRKKKNSNIDLNPIIAKK